MTNKRLRRSQNNENSPKPELFSQAIYTTLKNYITTTETNQKIMLTMNNYNMCDINSQHPRNEPYSHVILVCVKFMEKNLYQPIGSLVYKRDKVNESIAAFIKMLRMYVEILTNLGYVVVGSVSTSDIIFQKTFQNLVGSNHRRISDLLLYEIGSCKLVHVFDFKNLFVQVIQKWIEYDIYSYNGVQFSVSSWSHIKAAILLCEKYYLDATFLGCFVHLDLAVNIAVIRMLQKQVFDGKMSHEAIAALSILTIMTNIFILLCPSISVNFQDKKIRNLLMVYIKWSRSAYFKQKKSPLVVKGCVNYDAWSPNKAIKSSRSNEFVSNAVSYIADLLEKDFIDQITPSIFPKDLLTHINTEIKNCNIEKMQFMVHLTNTLVGVLKIVESLETDELKVLDKHCFNIEHVDYFVYHVKMVKNKCRNSVYKGRGYPVLDLEAAYEAFNRKDGALMVSYESIKN